MKKLSEYIRNEKQKAIDAEAERRQQYLDASRDKENYRESFNLAVIENLYHQAVKLKSSDFQIRELVRKEDSGPYILKLEFEISVSHSISQYYITFFGDFTSRKHSFYIKFEIAEGKSLLDKEITFSEAEEMNFEDYLVCLLEEVNR